MKQRVLILGAGGYIGQRVVTRLAASDWAIPVAAYHRAAPRAASGVQSIHLDATREADLTRALDGMGGVINCVAGDAATIVANADALFSATGRLKTAPRVVHLSTISVYGSAIGEIDETAPLRGDIGPYSAAKAQAEAHAMSCPTVVILRPGIVYGPQSPAWSGLIGRLLMTHRLGELGPAGEGICNLVHVEDVVDASLNALRASGIEGQAFNLSAAEPPTWNQYFQRYAAALGAMPVRRISRLRLMLELKVFGPPLKIVEIAASRTGYGHLDLAPPIRPWLLKLCGHPIKLKVHKAEQVLGMTWICLDEGLRGTAGWFRTCGGISGKAGSS